MTKKESIIQAVKDLLTSALGSVVVSRSRVDPFNEEVVDEKTAVSLEPVSETCDEPFDGIFDWELSLEIVFYRQSSQPESDLDSDYSKAFEALLSNRELGGLTTNIYPVSVAHNRFQGEKDIGEIRASFNIKYRTQQPNLTA